jgi:hypothetical protein
VIMASQKTLMGGICNFIPPGNQTVFTARPLRRRASSTPLRQCSTLTRVRATLESCLRATQALIELSRSLNEVIFNVNNVVKVLWDGLGSSSCRMAG